MAFNTARIGPAPVLAVDHIGTGDLVLCLHGIGGNRRNWHENLPEIAAAGFHAAAWDARGYGESDAYTAPLHFDDFRQDVLRVLDHFECKRAHLVGLSMGGRIAAAVAAEHPDRVASAVLCDTHLGFAHMPERARQKFVAMRKDPLIAGKEPRDIAPRIASALIGDPDHINAFETLVDSMGRLQKDGYIQAIEASTHHDQSVLFDRMRAPALVVVGALDRVTPPALSAEIAAMIPGAALEVIDDAGHLPNIEQADAFNRVVTRFLKAQPAVGG